MRFSPNRFSHLSKTAASFAASILFAFGSAADLDARETSVYSGTKERPASSNGGSLLNGNDIRIEADTNCIWVYQNTNDFGPVFWSNNAFISGTGFASEKGGALRFGEGGSTNTNPMIWTGDVTLIGDATIGTQTASPNSVGIITGNLNTESADYELLIRGRLTGASGRDISGIVTITSDNPQFTSNIQVGGGTLQLGDIRSVTASGYDWVQNADGTETYTQNTAKNFTFDGSTGSAGSGTINLTSVFGDTNSHLVFKRSGNVSITNQIIGTGDVKFDGTAVYSLDGGSLASTLNKVTVAKGATLVNCGHSPAYNSGDLTWDFSNPVSGDGFYQVNYTTLDQIIDPNGGTNPNVRISLSNLQRSVAPDFTGVYLMGNGYRYNFGTTWNSESQGFDLGFVEYAQLWVTSHNGRYNGDLYLRGTGWGTTEQFGAVRFAAGGNSTNDYSAHPTSVQALYGNVVLLGDSLIGTHAGKTAFALIDSDLTNYEGTDAALTLRGYSSNDRLVFTGTNELSSIATMGTLRLQVGHIGTLNGVKYDGTEGSLGSGAVSVGSGTILQFVRSGEVTLSNAFTNNGQILFDGTAEYIANTVLPGSVEIAQNAHLTTNKTPTASFSGNGILQVNNPNGDTTNEFTSPSVGSFNGTLVAGTGYRWGNPNSNASAYGAMDGGQLWILDAGISKPIFLEGTGWHKNERFGALRIAAGSTETSMANISGPVTLLGDTRISARNGNSPTTGLISGNISGDFQLELNSTGLHGTSVAGKMILTGTNSYGDTLISQKDTLQVGHIGTVNGKTYDGSTGTLGTGNVEIAKDAALIFKRSGNVSVPNAVSGTGSLTFSGTAEYEMNADGVAPELSKVEILDGAALRLTDGTVNREFTGDGTLILDGANLQLSIGTANSSLAQNPEAAYAFTGDLVLGDTAIMLDFENGFAPELGDVIYLISASESSLKDLDTSLISLDFSDLAPSFSWTFGIEELGAGFALSAQLGVPEPASWTLMLLGVGGGIFLLRKKRNRV